MRLPDDFLLGTAAAGTQVEGGRVRGSWHRWADEGHVRDGSHPSRANDHWRRLDTDVELLREAGIVPLVTLHHFANPLWLEDDGGWLDRRIVGRFERYARASLPTRQSTRSVARGSSAGSCTRSFSTA